MDGVKEQGAVTTWELEHEDKYKTRDPKEVASLREEISKHVEEYLSRGGKIERIAVGVTAPFEEKFNYKISFARETQSDGKKG